MAIQFITIKCPECGANQQLDKNRDSAYCTYCGAKIMISNANEQFLRAIIDKRNNRQKSDG